MILYVEGDIKLLLSQIYYNQQTYYLKHPTTTTMKFSVFAIAALAAATSFSCKAAPATVVPNSRTPTIFGDEYESPDAVVTAAAAAPYSTTNPNPPQQQHTNVPYRTGSRTVNHNSNSNRHTGSSNCIVKYHKSVDCTDKYRNSTDHLRPDEIGY